MIKLVILDVDGVMTDGTKHYNRFGRVIAKTFCDKDWTAIKRFRAIGVPVVFLTGDSYNERILKKRNLPVIVNRGKDFHTDKADYLDEILEEYDCTPEDVAYLGDDLFDYGIMNEVGHPYCPFDTPRIVHDVAAILPCAGGSNVVMALFDELESEGLIPVVPYDKVMEKIYELDLMEKF